MTGFVGWRLPKKRRWAAFLRLISSAARLACHGRAAACCEGQVMLCQWVAGRPALMPMVVIYGPVSGAGRFMDEGVFFPACGSAQLRGSMHASSYPLMAHFMSITHLEGQGLSVRCLCSTSGYAFLLGS